MSSIVRNVSRAKAERLVAAGRVFTCAIAVVAASIGYAVHRENVHEVLIAGGWELYAVAMLVKTFRRPHTRSSPVALAVDLAFIGTLLMTTGGVASIYFPTVVMTPFAANLLYDRRTVFLCAAGSLAVYLAALAVTNTTNDPRMMIMRFGVVLLLGLAIVLRSQYDARVARDIEQLATWPRTTGDDPDEAIKELLARAAIALRTSRAAAVWSTSDGETYFAQLDGDTFTLDQGVDGVRPHLHPVSREPVLSSALRERLRADAILSAKFVSQTVDGWLFLLDRKDVNADDLMLAEIVARLVSSGLDQVNLAAMIRDNAAAAERLRLSRDLHDGLLQSLGGLALHAQAARRAIEADPRGAEQRLAVVVEQLAESQHALRDFVDELRPAVALRRAPLRARLEQIARGIAAQWNIAIDVDVDEAVNATDSTLDRHLESVVAEALTNAAKHASASHVRARIAGESHAIRIDVEDDGRGFPFHGRYDLSRLVAEERGPWSLKERVMALGGELVIESSARGSRVEVRLPVAS